VSGAWSIVAAAIDFLDRLSRRVEDYPTWARWLFLCSVALVLAAIFVYAALFASVERRRGLALRERDQ
jgi:hypothetical protein